MRGTLRAWGPTLLLIAGFARAVHGTPLLLLVAAALPAVVYALLVLRLDRAQGEPAVLLLAAFLGGAVVAAAVAMAANDLLTQWVGVVVEGRAGTQLVAVVGGPLVEEIAKGLILVVLYGYCREHIDGVLDGIVYGAMVGIGFAMTENIGYFTLAAVQGGQPAFLQSVYTRAIVGGVNHAAFTACLGAGLGYLRRGSSYVVVGVGFFAAVAQHILWNGIASVSVAQLLCGAGADGICLATPSPFNLLVMIPLVSLGFLGPGGVTLLLIARLAARRQTAAA